ncbi:uncharacterized protein LOC124409479 [Diprion similis]|uniref:uncharacterized protein LOC124409479 n=1 Tax=Diprion similis TaxID=362088 RepID=UPI001EF905D7|nr:uncharacterized protein LOC124409479 [Diprion similis]
MHGVFCTLMTCKSTRVAPPVICRGALPSSTRTSLEYINTSELPPLSDGETEVPLVSSVRNLRVIIDSKLTFHQHIAKVSSSVHGVLYKLQQLREFTDTRLRRMLASALLLPLLHYCSPVLLGAGAVSDLKLQRLTNKGVRYIHDLPRDASITPHRQSLGWLTVSAGRELALACMVHSALRGLAPPILSELLLIHAPSRPRRGTRASLVVIPKHRTEAYRSSFAVAAPYIWNALPANVADIPTLTAFKPAARLWYLSRENPGQ